MMAERLLDEVRRVRYDGDTYVAGYTLRVAPGVWRVEFLRYRNGQGIVGRVSVDKMSKIAPELLSALKTGADLLRDYLERSQGVGSSRGAGPQDRTREGARDSECNGGGSSGYARKRSRWVPGAPVDRVAESGGNASVGGFRENSPVGAREGAR